MNIIELETPKNTIKYYAPQTKNQSPFFITEYGITLNDTPCYQLRMSSHISCVQYVISGSGVIICDNKIYTVHAGDTFLLPEGSDQIYYSNPDNHFERIWLNFKGELSKSLLKIYDIENITVFKNTNTYKLLEEIENVCISSENAEEYKRDTARAFLKLVQFLSENKGNAADTGIPTEEIRLFIDRHITENLHLSDIANRFAYTKEHIIRIFKKLYGITPHQYIIQSKIRLSMIMLLRDDETIENISEKLNFSDPHHFSAQFRKFVGIRPSLYRQNLKKQKGM